MASLSSISRVLRTAQHILPLAILGTCAAMMWPTIQSLDLVQLQAYLSRITPTQWLAAASFTALSFWAVGQYDVIAHRQFDTGMPPEMAWRGGVTAIALSQTLGFAVVTATLARWRMLRGFGPGLAAMITAMVSVTFMLSVVVLTALACLFLPMPDGLRPFAALALLAVLTLMGLGLFFCRLRLRGKTVELPGLNAGLASMGWAFIDIAAAYCALWVLIPHEARPDILALLPVFCLALTAGLLSGTPGGAGPFELVLVSLTVAGTPAHTSEYALLVAVFGFRIVYYALPAALATLRLALRPAPLALWRDPPPPCVSKAPRAETAVIWQTGGHIEQVGASYSALWATGHALVSLHDPFSPADQGFFDQLRARAYLRNRVALVYKAGRRSALAARHAGWQVLHISDEAILDLATYSLNPAERSGLRRKLRKAERAGVRIRKMHPHDLPALSRIDAQWQTLHGRARGGTMGRFCPNYLARQRVYVAELDDRIIAFASFHCGAREWSLDILRYGTNMPDGTMQALVQHAIDTARASLVPQFSLSAVSACPDTTSPLWRSLSMRAVGISGSAGLRQFKSSFAPRWAPLYVAAPTRYALCIGLLDVAREVFWPARLHQGAPLEVSELHYQDENYDIASSAAA